MTSVKWFDHIGNIIECVPEFVSRRHVRLTEPGKIGRDHMKPVGKRRDQITEHVTRAREAVQEQQFR